MLYMYPQQKQVQLTVDDAPGTSNKDMRALLAQYKIKTMFFVEGEFVEKRSGDVINMVHDGHQLGLHTWDHPQLTKMVNDEDIKQEFLKTDALVKKLTGQSMAPNWRPPYGLVDARLKRIATELGFTKMWLWDVDSLDWKYRTDTDKTVEEVMKGLNTSNADKSIVLIHDKPTTVTALKRLIPRLLSEGYGLADFP